MKEFPGPRMKGKTRDMKTLRTLQLFTTFEDNIQCCCINNHVVVRQLTHHWAGDKQKVKGRNLVNMKT